MQVSPPGLLLCRSSHDQSKSRQFVIFQLAHVLQLSVLACVEGKKLIASGWRASGLTEAVRRCKEDGIDSRMLIDPFAALRI